MTPRITGRSTQNKKANTDHDGGEIEALFAFRQTKDCIANQKFMDQLGEEYGAALQVGPTSAHTHLPTNRV